MDRDERKAEISNEIYLKSLGSPPYKNRTLTTDKYLKEGDEFFIVMYKKAQVPGGFASDYEVKNIRELREKLAVKKSWKNEDIDDIVVRKYRVREGEPIPVREGIIGEVLENTQGSTHFGETLKGGKKQWEFVEGWDDESINFIDLISEKTIK